MLKKYVCKWFNLVPRYEYEDQKVQADFAKRRLKELKELTEVDLSRKILGLPITGETVEKLEQLAVTEPNLWKMAESLQDNDLLKIAVDVSRQTFRDKIVMDPLGDENRLLNRGAMNGAQHVLDVIRVIASHANRSEEPKLEGLDRHKAL